MRTYWTTF